MTRWQRPSGPLNVWKVLDGYERLADGTQKPVKFSIQDIPNEDKRKEELYDLMIKEYLSNEPCSKCDNMAEEPEGIEDYRRLCEFAVEDNIAVGCYKLDSDGKVGELVGANVLFVITDKTHEELQKLRDTYKSKTFKKTYCDLLDRLSVDADPFEIYKVDKYIASTGLCVKTKYNGQNLGYHMLNTRSAIGKKYGIHATSTVFSAGASQRQAKRAGFEARSSINFVELLDDQGNPLYPNIESKSAELMMKRLP